MLTTKNMFGEMEPALRSCSSCGVEIHYMRFKQWPGLGPNLCDPCGIKFDRINHDNAILQIQNDLIEKSRIPNCYDCWDNAESAKRATTSMYQWIIASGRNHSLYWGGNNGSGKTHTVCKVALDMIRDARISVTFYNCSKWLDLLMQLKTSDKTTYNKEIQIACTNSIVILDDIGKEKATESKMELMYNVIDLREQQKKATWFTSNYSINQLPDRIGENYGNAIKVRIERMCGNAVVK